MASQRINPADLSTTYELVPRVSPPEEEEERPWKRGWALRLGIPSGLGKTNNDYPIKSTGN